jgi:hypothetical protein
MVLDRGSGLVGELALRQARTSSRSVVAETRLPAGEPDSAGGEAVTRATAWQHVGEGEAGKRHERIPGTGHGRYGSHADTWRRKQAEEGSDIGQG